MKWRASIKDCTLAELAEIRDKFIGIPPEVRVTLVIDGEEKYFDEYIYEREDEFFNTTADDYKKIVGKVFINPDKNIILKVIAFNEYPGEKMYTEFFYIQYIREDEEWLVDMSHNLHKYIEKPYLDSDHFYKEHYSHLPKETSINLAAERSYCLGIDGNLYVDYTCGSNWVQFKQMKNNATFEMIADGDHDEYR